MAAITTNAMADRRLPALPLDGVSPLADDWQEHEKPQACTPPRTPDPPQAELDYAELHADTLPEFVDHSNLEVAQSAAKYSAHANDKFLFTGTNDKDADYYDHPPSTLMSPLSADGAKAAGTGYCATGQTLGAGGVSETGLPSAQPCGRSKIWGMPRQAFCIFLVVGVFLAVGSVALGIGLGIGLHHSYETAAGSSPASSTRTKQRRQLSSLANVTATFAECLDLCANNSQCIAAGWADFSNQTFCWQKKTLSAPGSVPGWYFAIEDDVVGN